VVREGVRGWWSRGGVVGWSGKGGAGAPAQWGHAVRKTSPQRPLVVAQPAPAHRRRRALDLLFVDGAAFVPAAIAGLASGNGTSSAAPSGAVGSGILSRLTLNRPGRAGGSGTSLAAATGSGARGTSMPNVPGFLIRPP